MKRKIEINYEFDQTPETADVNMLDEYAKYKALKEILHNDNTSGELSITLSGKEYTGHWSMSYVKPD